MRWVWLAWQSVPTSADFVAAARILLEACHAAGRPLTAIFLATDDLQAVDAFRAAFGGLCHVRAGVQRVAGGVNPDGSFAEVHLRSEHNPSCTLQDAVDGARPMDRTRDLGISAPLLCARAAFDPSFEQCTRTQRSSQSVRWCCTWSRT
jgi:hypothetical protein